MKRLLLLCTVLLWAQLALAAHGIEHAFHEHDETCVECLSLPGMLAVPAQPPRVPAPILEQTRAIVAVPPAPNFPRHLSFRSRAPPFAQSR